MILATLLLAALTLIPHQGAESASQQIVQLGCQNFAVQAGKLITFGVSLTTITSGDIGVFPGASITGNYKLVTGTAHSNDVFAQQCSADSIWQTALSPLRSTALRPANSQFQQELSH